jgi:ATP diphosphatase
MVLGNVFCGECKGAIIMNLAEGKMSGRSLVLQGSCATCGAKVARVIEPAEE